MFEFSPMMPLPRWNGAFFAGRPYDDRFIDYVRTGKHHEVEGWVTEGALTVMLVCDQLQRAAGREGPIVEIGVHHGRFFIANALTCRGDERALAIDVFDDQHLNIDQSGKGDRERFESNLLAHNVDRSLVDVVKGDSLKLKTKDFGKAYAGRTRLFSVDGGHTIRHVLNDMALAASVIDDYGVVIVDDFFNQLWPDVTQGTYEYLAKFKDLAPFAYGDNKLYLCKPAVHGYFMDGVRLVLPRISANPKEVVLGGYPCHHVNAPAPGNLLATPKYEIGRRLLTSAAGDGALYFGAGWCGVEPWGTWTQGESTFVFLPVDRKHDKGQLNLMVRGHASLRSGKQERTAHVFANGQPVGALSFGPNALSHDLPLPPLGDCDELRLEFRMDDVFSPKSAKIGEDDRRLGFAIYELTVS
jgi:hypothetical protein